MNELADISVLTLLKFFLFHDKNNISISSYYFVFDLSQFPYKKLKNRLLTLHVYFKLSSASYIRTIVLCYYIFKLKMNTTFQCGKETCEAKTMTFKH